MLINFIFKLLRKISNHEVETDFEKRDLTSLFLKEFAKFPKEHQKKILSIFIKNTFNYFLNKDTAYFTAFVDINNRCNLHCPNCINNCLNNNSDDLTWSLEHLNEVFAKLKKKTKMIFIPGGEPFMNLNLIDSIEQNQDLLFFIFTNGTITSEYQKLVKKDLNNVVILFSIDGDKKYHDTKRGNGVFDIAIKNLRFLRENGVPCAVSSVVDSKNIDMLFSKENIDFIKENDVNALLFLKDAHDNNPDFMENYYNKSQELAKGLGMTFPIFNMPYMEKQSKLNDGLCVGGKLFIHINAYGEITSCPFDLKICGSLDTASKLLNEQLHKDDGCCSYNAWRKAKIMKKDE